VLLIQQQLPLTVTGTLLEPSFNCIVTALECVSCERRNAYEKGSGARAGVLQCMVACAVALQPKPV
jgi:hypothetical protein